MKSQKEIKTNLSEFEASFVLLKMPVQNRQNNNS